MDNLKKTTGYWKLKEEALDRTLCRTRYGSGYGPTIGWPWKERRLQMYRRSTRSHSVEYSLWKNYGPVVRQTTKWMN